MTEFRKHSLRSRLVYTPRELQFGTSGRRGEVIHLSQLEIYINALAELSYLQTLPKEEGGITRGDLFYIAYDLRPSSTALVSYQEGRGEIAQAIDRAIRDAGMETVNLGHLPTPALSAYAFARRKGSIMITGSHIPFDRNGYKTNTSRGELLKTQEGPIEEAVHVTRQRIYEEPFESSLFNERGMFKEEHHELPQVDERARADYIDRYTQFFSDRPLQGQRLLFYQHSAVGRDLFVEILEELGATVFPCGRSDTFVPIDTENIDAEQLAVIQALTNDVVAQYGPVDAVVSTDGDSDRPLLLGVDASTRKVHFYGGDLLGMVVASYLKADAVVVPISCNDAINLSPLAAALQPKTKIGSPYVISGMQQAAAKGYRTICGWEANGGFLLGSDVVRNGNRLTALPTRDALLPIVGVLCSAREQNLSLAQLFQQLPRRYSKAALLSQFPRPISLKIMRRFSPETRDQDDISFASGTSNSLSEADRIRCELETFFPATQKFAPISNLNYTDGVRVRFRNNEVAHLRPSGNADELRFYAVADTPERAAEMVSLGVAEPDGILRRMEHVVTSED